jgi:hypothetical protein
VSAASWEFQKKKKEGKKLQHCLDIAIQMIPKMNAMRPQGRSSGFLVASWASMGRPGAAFAIMVLSWLDFNPFLDATRRPPMAESINTHNVI